jgi:hypothetical protein
MFKHWVNRGAVRDVAIVSLHESGNFGLGQSSEEVSQVARGVMGVRTGRNLLIPEGGQLHAVPHVHFHGPGARFLPENLMEPVILVGRVAEKHPAVVAEGCGKPQTALELLEDLFLNLQGLIDKEPTVFRPQKPSQVTRFPEKDLTFVGKNETMIPSISVFAAFPPFDTASLQTLHENSLGGVVELRVSVPDDHSTVPWDRKREENSFSAGLDRL